MRGWLGCVCLYVGVLVGLLLQVDVRVATTVDGTVGLVEGGVLEDAQVRLEATGHEQLHDPDDGGASLGIPSGVTYQALQALIALHGLRHRHRQVVQGAPGDVPVGDGGDVPGLLLQADVRDADVGQLEGGDQTDVTEGDNAQEDADDDEGSQ